MLRCHEVLQPLGYLAWAAAGKDPGVGPLAILAEAQRSARYTEVDLRGLDFESVPPVAADLSRAWHLAMHEAELIVSLLPAEHAGTCVLDQVGKLLTLEPSALGGALAGGAVSYHPGRIQGAWPVLR